MVDMLLLLERQARTFGTFGKRLRQAKAQAGSSKEAESYEDVSGIAQ
jgi:hypothetical protein